MHVVVILLNLMHSLHKQTAAHCPSPGASGTCKTTMVKIREARNVY